MAFVITQPCIDTTDQACVEVCPVDCIHFEQGTDRMLYINPAECIDCGACQPACPVQAIFPEGDVPADQQRFIAINAAWYSDPAGARAQAGGAGAPAGGATPTPATAAAAAPAPTEAPSGAPASNGAAPAAEPAHGAAPSEVTAAPSTQVPAEEPEHEGTAPVVPVHRPPSPMGVLTLAGMIAGFAVMFLIPTPRALVLPVVGDVSVGAMLGLLVVLFFLGGFVKSQTRDLSTFAAKHERPRETWRHQPTIWRRGEEARRFDQERAVKAIVETRFAFPTMDHPNYRTHVNVPEPELALEFGGGGGEKMFPDILVVEYPGNYPRMVAQVETGDTVTRDQAERVWKQLESEEAPLYLYVPTGYGTAAKDYALAAGIKNIRIRTWTRQPAGVLVHEI